MSRKKKLHNLTSKDIKLIYNSVPTKFDDLLEQVQDFYFSLDGMYVKYPLAKLAESYGLEVYLRYYLLYVVLKPVHRTINLTKTDIDSLIIQIYSGEVTDENRLEFKIKINKGLKLIYSDTSLKFEPEFQPSELVQLLNAFADVYRYKNNIINGITPDSVTNYIYDMLEKLFKVPEYTVDTWISKMEGYNILLDLIESDFDDVERTLKTPHFEYFEEY